MLTQSRRFWSDLKAGFFFFPSVLVGAHVTVAIALTSTGLAVNKPWMADWPKLFGAGAEGARGMLSTIAASMMTVVGVTLSMTLVTLALASSQYTSRILRNFIRDRTTQLVLGLFAGTYCYCLIVLRTIRGEDEGGFVPGLAVLVGVIMAVAGIAVLIYFIHHIATSIQASNIIATVAGETITTVDRLYPADASPEMPDDVPHHGDTSTRWRPITAATDGYIDRVDFARLDQLALMYKTVVRIERGIGDFVVSGAPVLAVLDETDDAETLTNALRRAIDISRHRTLEQNVAYGIRQLVDIALRALSPGVNDTTTAVMCIDYLTAILVRLATRRVSDFQQGVGSHRVIRAYSAGFADFFGQAFDQIREDGRRNVVVLQRLLDAIGEIGAAQICAAHRQTLLDQTIIMDEYIESLESSRDAERLRSVARRLRARLGRLGEDPAADWRA